MTVAWQKRERIHRTRVNGEKYDPITSKPLVLTAIPSSKTFLRKKTKTIKKRAFVIHALLLIIKNPQHIFNDYILYIDHPFFLRFGEKNKPTFDYILYILLGRACFTISICFCAKLLDLHHKTYMNNNLAHEYLIYRNMFHKLLPSVWRENMKCSYQKVREYNSFRSPKMSG